MEMKVQYLKLVSVTLALAGLVACDDSSETGEEMQDDLMVEEPGAETESADIKRYVLPSPFQLAALVKKADVSYTRGILNDVNNASNYTSNFSKGLNLGIYGADLGYALIYDQTQDGISLLNTCKNIAGELGITGAFEASMIDRIEANIENHDSLIRIATESFGKADMYLKESDRQVTSSLIIAGGWIEALYIATQIAEQTMKPEIVNRIGEQKVSLELLILQLKKFESESDEIANLISNLQDLAEVYTKVTISYDYKSTTVDTSRRKTTYNSTSTVEISEETMFKISEKISSIRNKIIG